jgi:hypothetical protein
MNRSVLLMVSVVSLFSVFPARCGAYQDALTDKRVAVLIEMMLKADTEQKAFSDLEALGCGAVPAIIRRMDDRRSLPDQHLSLRNRSPYAFQDMRHYVAIQVVDALAIILNQLTGQDFWSHNGARTKRQQERYKAGGSFCSPLQHQTFVIHHEPSSIRLTAARGRSRSIRPTVTSHLFHRSSWCSRLKNWNCGWASSKLVAGCTGSRASEILPANQLCSQTDSTTSLRSSVGIVRSSFLFHVVHATGIVVNKPEVIPQFPQSLASSSGRCNTI